MRVSAASFALILLLIGPAAGQICGPTPAMQASASVDGLFLDITGVQGSTNSRATPPDYSAESGLGQAFTLTVFSNQGPPGESLGIYFSLGGPQAPLNAGGAGRDIFIDIGQSGTPFPLNFFPVVEGPGLGGNTFGAVTVAPPGSFALSGLVPLLPSLSGRCLVMQGASVRPSAPLGIALTNAVTLGINPTVIALAPTQFAAEGVALTAITPGTSPSGDVAVLSDGLGATITAPATSGMFSVPIGAGSGPVGYTLAAAPGIATARDANRLSSWLSVIDTAINTGTPGAITATPGSIPGLTRFTAIQSLASATSTNVWSISLGVGDIMEVEVLSTDAAGVTLLDGWGNRFNPGATQGFDPRVTIRLTANSMPLQFDTGGVAPFNIQRDDDSGPGGNAFTRFQARTLDIYEIVIDAAAGTNFVTGSYLLNLRIQSGAVPSVNTIGPAMNNPVNVVTPGSTVTVQSSNLVTSNPYTIILTPVHGLFGATLLSGTATSATQLTFNAPATFTPGSFTVGSYRVQIEDPSTLRRSLLWPTAPLRLAAGVVPDVLVMRATTGTIPTVGVLNALAANTGTMVFNGVNAGGFAQFAAAPGQRIYVEAVGVDQLVPNRLDARAAFSGATNGVWNPNMQLYSAFGPAGVGNTILGFNDADGILPFAYFPAALGIGDGAAILTTTDATAAGLTHTVLVLENLCWVSCGQSKSGLLNVVVF